MIDQNWHCEICGMAIDPAADSAWDRPALDWPAAHEQCAAEAAAGVPVERISSAAYRRRTGPGWRYGCVAFNKDDNDNLALAEEVQS
jgi:hypothetical protein